MRTKLVRETTECTAVIDLTLAMHSKRLNKTCLVWERGDPRRAPTPRTVPHTHDKRRFPVQPAASLLPRLLSLPPSGKEEVIKIRIASSPRRQRSQEQSWRLTAHMLVRSPQWQIGCLFLEPVLCRRFHDNTRTLQISALSERWKRKLGNTSQALISLNNIGTHSSSLPSKPERERERDGARECYNMAMFLKSERACKRDSICSLLIEITTVNLAAFNCEMLRLSSIKEPAALGWRRLTHESHGVCPIPESFRILCHSEIWTKK